jgi:multicomponent K+:H+ antiporter subunit D
MIWPHWIMLPIALPLMTGALLTVLGPRLAHWQTWISGASATAGLGIAIMLLGQANTGEIQAYLVGNWAAPFGISLALDRLAALMVVLTSIVGLAAHIYATGGDSTRGRHFHALLQFQLMGLNGAFLTADLFNLFVFFEVLLIASYGLLLHGGGTARLKAAVHYVGFNLAGSALFLIAVSLLYGLTGTLNMADLAQRLPQLPPDRSQLIQVAALLLLVVFSVKAALLPLYFWLPATYGAASAPVAAFFAIMTKVGVYAILRVTTLIFGADAGAAAMVASPWLPGLALATLFLGAVGAVSAPNLRALVGNVVVASAGTLLLAVGLAQLDTIAAGLFYLVNSTVVAAGVFLLADQILAARARYAPGEPSQLWEAVPMGQARVPLGILFFVLAAASAGLPPLAGFLGKALLLQAAMATPWAHAVVAVVLGSSFLMLIAFSRAGSLLFWKTSTTRTGLTQHPWEWKAGHLVSLLGLLAVVIACAIGAGPLAQYTAKTAAQLLQPQDYRDAVMGAQPVPAAQDVRRELRERIEAGGKK